MPLAYNKRFLVFGASILFVLSLIIAKVFIIANNLDTTEIDTTCPVKMKSFKPSSGIANTTWMIQISDTHLSMLNHPERTTEFADFCNNTLDAIKPKVVIASGDLTDGITPAFATSENEVEWQRYWNILQENKVMKKILWLDIRGNHDNFNVASKNDPISNYYLTFSAQGGNHSHSYMSWYKTEGGSTVAFIAVDECLEIGPRGIFNVLGALSEDEMSLLVNMSVVAMEKADYIVWFGHYPTSAIYRRDELRNLIGCTDKSVAYLCGHLHDAGGLVRSRLYTFQKAGYQELELLDWKKHRMFRVMALDQGEFTFVDVKYNDWPIALVTHPKSLTMNTPRDLSSSYDKSTHIRILAFSNASIVTVRVALNGGNWVACDHVEGPLYTTTWNPFHYSAGENTLSVRVVDAFGEVKEINHTFALDGTLPHYGFLSRVILMSSLAGIFQTLFVTVALLIIGGLSWAKYEQRLYSRNLVAERTALLPRYCGSWSLRFRVLASIDSVYYPLVLYPAYLGFGPWIFGEFVDGHYGAAFFWGLIISWKYVPEQSACFFGFVQLLIFHVPMIFTLAGLLNRRLLSFGRDMRLSRNARFSLKNIIFWTSLAFYYVLFLAWLYMQFVVLRFLSWSTGILTYVSPLSSGWILIVIYTYYKINWIPADRLLALARPATN